VEIFKTRVKPPEDTHHSLISLEEEEEQNAEVDDAQAKDHPPNCRVRSCEGPIRKCKHWNDQEEEKDPADAGPKVILVVTLISETKIVIIKNTYIFISILHRL
jgi:hypothetical protein